MRPRGRIQLGRVVSAADRQRLNAEAVQRWRARQAVLKPILAELMKEMNSHLLELNYILMNEFALNPCNYDTPGRMRQRFLEAHAAGRDLAYAPTNAGVGHLDQLHVVLRRYE